MVNLKIKLPEGFLDEEVRDGFTVTTERKKIWAVELDLLVEALRVCNKYGLKVWADSGTMLGAVRHKGFIPWDDDIDLAISREDYEKLCEIGPREFRYPYFFQTEDTDPGAGRGHAQLRNSETAAILKHERDTGYTFNQGIFIDFFPLDNVPDDPKKRAELVYKIEKNRNKSISYTKLYYSKNPGTKSYRRYFARVLQGFIKAFHIKYNNVYYRQMEKDKLTYRDLKDSRFIASLYLLWRGDPDALVFERAWFKESLEVPFEFIKVKIPASYEEYLTKLYGEWREFVVGTSDHGDTIFDTDHSYKNYL